MTVYLDSFTNDDLLNILDIYIYHPFRFIWLVLPSVYPVSWRKIIYLITEILNQGEICRNWWSLVSNELCMVFPRYTVSPLIKQLNSWHLISAVMIHWSTPPRPNGYFPGRCTSPTDGRCGGGTASQRMPFFWLKSWGLKSIFQGPCTIPIQADWPFFWTICVFL